MNGKIIFNLKLRILTIIVRICFYRFFEGTYFQLDVIEDVMHNLLPNSLIIVIVYDFFWFKRKLYEIQVYIMVYMFPVIHARVRDYNICCCFSIDKSTTDYQNIIKFKL